MTKRQQIVDQIVTNLKNISIANGYSTDVNIYEWRDTILPEEELPALIVRDIEDEAEDEGLISHQLKFEIEGIIQAGEQSVAKARDLLGDVVKNMYQNYNTGEIKNVAYTNSEIGIDHQKKITASFIAEFLIWYVSNRGEI